MEKFNDTIRQLDIPKFLKETLESFWSEFEKNYGKHDNAYLSGGYALDIFTQQNNSTDIDVFLTSFSSNERDNSGPKIFNKSLDFVRSRFDTISTILLNFDLPICRIAFNKTNMFISDNCKIAIDTKTFVMPHYYSNIIAYMEMIKKRKNRKHFT